MLSCGASFWCRTWPDQGQWLLPKERQYNLVSALAKRHSENDDDLCIFAVGDDDQNIYQWRGGSNQHIERYQQEYKADISYLVENFRSSKMIIATANLLIEKNRDRLKAKHPIQINNTRQELPLGGRWQTLDHLRQGRVLCIRLPAADSATGNRQHPGTSHIGSVAASQRFRAVFTGWRLEPKTATVRG